MNQQKTVWFIDENRDQRVTYGEMLQRVFQNEAQVKEVEPSATFEEMKGIIDDPTTISVIIDEKLNDTGIAAYLGIDLAKYFRALNPKLPIYILTTLGKDEAEISDGAWSVENVYSKDEFRSNFDLITARMRRNALFYSDYLAERESRFSELLDKSLSENITADELEEFEKLKYIRMKSISADEIGMSPELNEKIQKHLKFLKKFEEDEGK